MLMALRFQCLPFRPPPPSLQHRLWKLGFSGSSHAFSSLTFESSANSSKGLLDLTEVEKVLTDVKANDVKVILVKKHVDWVDYMVIATSRSTWHVKNIAQALIYKAKQKQKGAQRMILPSMEGQEGGKWIVIDYGKVVVHALDEKARAYYNLENLWTSVKPQNEPDQLHTEDGVDVDPRTKVRLVVPNSSCGSIIGKGGSIIKFIRLLGEQENVNVDAMWLSVGYVFCMSCMNYT